MDSYISFFFFCFINISVLGSLLLVFSLNAVHSVLFLVLVFCMVSAILLLMGATFLGVLFIIVYVGAIAVLFLFVIMMLDIKVFSFNFSFWIFFFLFCLMGLVFLFFFLHSLKSIFNFGLMFYCLFDLSFIYSWFWFDVSSLVSPFQNIEVIGFALYTYNYILFIFASVLLLLAMICSIFLTLKKLVIGKVQQVSGQVFKIEQLSVVFYALSR